HELFADRLDGARCALPTELGGDRERLPARLVELVPRLLVAGRRLHAPVDELAALDVADAVVRAGDRRRELVHLLDHRARRLRVERVERWLAEQVSQPELLEEEELDLAQVCFVPVERLGHERLLPMNGYSVSTDADAPRQARRASVGARSPRRRRLRRA